MCEHDYIFDDRKDYTDFIVEVQAMTDKERKKLIADLQAAEIKERIDEMAGAFLFTYNGRNCGVDPISHTHFEMWYGEDDMVAKSIDEVMTAPLFGGKCLNEIASDSTIECW